MKTQQKHVSPSGDANILQSSESDRKLFDSIDELRHLGIQTNINLPQIVVVGSQSSGKSSVIDAICKFNVPKKSAVCTRFALEIVLRHADEPNWSVDLIPSSDRSTEDKAKMNSFGATAKSHFIDPQRQLGKIVELAEEYLGITDATGTKRFANDILRLKWDGPDLLNLDLVDLPGLFHGQGASQSVDDAPYVKKLVEGYMSRPSTIILAVISARDSIANQEVTTLVAKHDKQGSRTLGIITKPDDVEGPALQKEVIDLAMNETIPLNHGYHILKNRSWRNQDDKNDKRDLDEARFLAKAPYDVIPAADKGIAKLGPKLTTLYREHIMKSMPQILMDGQTALQLLQADLAAEGSINDTMHYRDRLINIGNRVIHAMLDIMNDRFDDPSLDLSDEHIYVNKRIENLIGAVVLPTGEGYRLSENEELINKVLANYITHGHPGQFDGQLAKHLCHEQTKEWPYILEELITSVITACENCVGSVLTSICSKRAATSILELICIPITEAIKEAFLKDLQTALPKLDKLDRSQIFSAATIANAIKTARAKETARLVKSIKAKESQPHTNYESSPVMRSPRTPRAGLRTKSHSLEDEHLLKLIEDETRLDRTTVAEAIECSRLHCLSERQRIANYFNKHKVNTQLWQPFEKDFNYDAFRDLTDKEVDQVMGENEEAKEKKRVQQEKVKKLQEILGELQSYGGVTSTSISAKQTPRSKRKATSPMAGSPRKF